MKIKVKNILNFFLLNMIAITILAQLRIKIEPYIRSILYLIWGVTFLISFILKGEISINKYAKIFIGSTILVIIYGRLLSVIVDENYSNLLMMKYMPIAVIAYLIGMLIASYTDSNLLVNNICWYYVIGCTILAIFIKVYNFSDLSSWYESLVYTYRDGKNQIGMIFSSASLIALFYLFPRITSKKIKLLLLLCSIFMIYVVSLVQCRTALIAFAFAIIIGLFFEKKLKIWHLIGIGALAVILLRNEFIWKYIDHVFFISKYSGQGTNAFFSGRLDFWKKAIISINNNFFIGVGSYYVDCLYLQVLAEGGIFEFLFVMPVIIFKIYFSFKYRKNNHLSEVVFIMTFYYLITSMLEAQTPFGPGTSACIFWLLSGFVDFIGEEKLCIEERNIIKNVRIENDK